MATPKRQWWVGREERLTGGYWRVTYNWHDGTKAVVTFPDIRFTPGNIELTGEHLSNNPSLRHR